MLYAGESQSSCAASVGDSEPENLSTDALELIVRSASDKNGCGIPMGYIPSTCKLADGGPRGSQRAPRGGQRPQEGTGGQKHENP